MLAILSAWCLLSSGAAAMGGPPIGDEIAMPAHDAEDQPAFVWMWPSSVTRAEFAPVVRGDMRAPGAFEYTRVQLSWLLERYGITTYSEFPTSAGAITLLQGAPMLQLRANGTFVVATGGPLPSGVFLALGPASLGLGDGTSTPVGAHELVCVRAIEPVLIRADDAIVPRFGIADNEDSPPGFRASGSVSCQSGYYACCNCVTGQGQNNGASCHCQKNDVDVQCSEGGPGSGSASISCQQ